METRWTSEVQYRADKKKMIYQIFKLEDDIMTKNTEIVKLEKSIVLLKADKIIASMEYDSASDKVTDKKKELDGIEADITTKGKEVIKLETDVQEWSDKADMEERRAKEAVRKAGIAEEVYGMFKGDPLDVQYEMREKIINLSYENEQLREENKSLKMKL